MQTSKRILLIDDDPDDQIFFRDAIQTINPELQCDLASGFHEAVRQLEQPLIPELIFMDLNMPIINGFECLFYIRQQKQYKDIPVVIYTTSKNINDIEKTKQMGANWYMTKPDDFKVLCKKLKKILQNDFTNNRYTI